LQDNQIQSIIEQRRELNKMSLSANYAPVKEIGNGVTTVFTGNWDVIAEAYGVVALENVSTGVRVIQTLGVDYSLTFTSSGFTVTFLITPPPNTEYVVISRDTSLDQAIPFRTSKGFQGANIEGSLDKITAQNQDQQDAIERSIKTAIASTTTDLIFPEPVADMVISFNAAGDQLEATVAKTDIAAASANAIAAAASAAAALISEAAALASEVAAAASAAGVNLPSIAATDTGKLLIVNAGGTSHELHTSGGKGDVYVSGGADAVPEWVTSGAVNTSLMGGGVGANPSFRALALADLPSGSKFLIEEKTITSSTATADFTTGLSGTLYSSYVIELINVVPVTSGAYLAMQFSDDAGSTWYTTANYTYNLTDFLSSSGAFAQFNSNGASSARISGTSNNNAYNGVSGEVKVYGLEDTKNTIYTMACTSDAGNSKSNIGGGMLNTAAAAYDSIRLMFNTGNISGARIRLYGIKA